MIIKKFLAFVLGLVIGISSTTAFAAKPKLTLNTVAAEVATITGFLKQSLIPYLQELDARVAALEQMHQAPSSESSSI